MNDSAPSSDPVMENVEMLQEHLNALYLSAEKIMCLRDPNPESLRSLSANIESKYEELMQKVEQIENEKNSSIALSAIQNKSEFDAHKCEFLSKCGLQQYASSSKKTPSVEGASLPSRGSSRSKASSSSTVKRRAAEAKFIAAQIRAEEAKERAKEELQLQQQQHKMQIQLQQQRTIRSQREAQRELKVAAAKFQVWDQSDERRENSESSYRTVLTPATNKPMTERTLSSFFPTNSLMNPNISTENIAGQYAT